ncbi:hypothetical protein LXA43DRAFT_164305 [Ganoderma leucocontextum]|nr:hypothetical protein LXA43DRAFT_164305 [Ganoderma leucocontextum]
MSYLPRVPTQGAAAPVRRNLTTPLPRSVRPDEEGKLTYKPSQLQWVKLVWDAEPDAGFYAGRSVQIYAAEQITPSPTQYGGQTALWRRDDHDTIYRFRKRQKVKTIHIVETPFSVAHIKLLTKRPDRDNPLRACQYGPKRYPMDRK